MSDFCCAAFAKHTGTGSGGFEWVEWTDGWHVNGCCHGGCFVLQNIKFCPFCGTRLAKGERKP